MEFKQRVNAALSNSFNKYQKDPRTDYLILEVGGRPLIFGGREKVAHVFSDSSSEKLVRKQHKTSTQSPKNAA